MTDKEQKNDLLKNESKNFNENSTHENKPIIIDGVNIFDTLDNWADLISQEWCSGEYPVAEIIKNYILDINKQLARKTRECEDLKLILQQSKDNNKSTMLLLAEKNKECEELKEKIKAYENLALHIKCPHCNKELDLILDGTEEKVNLFDSYRKALEEIEGIAGMCPEFDSSVKRIYDIINKAKGEE